MATDSTNVYVGAATVSLGAYVSNAGAGSLTDVGHTKAPVELAPEFENYDVSSERVFGILKSVPIGASYTLKVPMMECTLEHLRVATRQASTQLNNTTSTLAVSDPQEQYHQITCAITDATAGTQTLTLWKCQVASMEPVPFAKGDSQVYNVTFRVLYDDSITTPTTNGYYWKRVNS